jgi:hypothetical protein
MAYYDTLITAWNSVTQPPVGVTGTALANNMSTSQKLDAVNSWVVHPGVSKRAVFSPSEIINVCVPTDVQALTSAQRELLTLALAGTQVDGSVGTTVRAIVAGIFANSANTLTALSTLVAPYDNPTELWWKYNGYTSPISEADLNVAGLT